MDISVLERKVNTLTAVQQESVSYYIDFLLSQNMNTASQKREPLDFSKYNTATCIWGEDAQLAVNRMRSDDRF